MAIRKINMYRAIDMTVEGSNDDAHETILSFEEPTHDNALVMPNKSGTLATTTDIDDAATALAIALGG